MSVEKYELQFEERAKKARAKYARDVQAFVDSLSPDGRAPVKHSLGQKAALITCGIVCLPVDMVCCNFTSCRLFNKVGQRKHMPDEPYGSFKNEAALAALGIIVRRMREDMDSPDVRVKRRMNVLVDLAHDVLERMWEVDPRVRFPTAQAVLARAVELGVA